MRIERHIFGSYSGYTTLARSPGVSADEARFLESGAYGFGQSNDRHFVKSLAKNPAYFTRVLGGGRRGLTRVLEGNPDDNDRPTLCLITLVVAQRDWDVELCGDVDLLLDNPDLWRWDGAAPIPPLDVAVGLPSRSIPRKSLAKVLALVSEVERAVASRRGVVVSPDDYSRVELRALEMLIPPAARARFTSGYRTLGGQLPVTLNCPAAEAAAAARATFRFRDGENHVSPFAAHLRDAGLDSGVIPVDEISSYRHFAVADAPAASPTAAAVAAASPVTRVVHRTTAWPAIVAGVIGLALAVGTFFAGRSMGSVETAAAEQAKQQQDRLRLDQEHTAAVTAAQTAAAADQTKRVEDKLRAGLSVTGSGIDAIIDQAKAKFTAASSASTAERDDVRQVREEKEKLRAFYDAEKTRQRDWFQSVKADLDKAVGPVSLAGFPERLRRVQAIANDLKSARDEWPWAAAEDREWVEDLKRARATAEELLQALARMNKVAQILDDCEEEMRRYNPDAAKDVLSNVHASLGQLIAEVRGLPGRHGKFSTDTFKADLHNRARQVERWLNETEKPKGEGKKNGEPPAKGRGAPAPKAAPKDPE